MIKQVALQIDSSKDRYRKLCYGLNAVGFKVHLAQSSSQAREMLDRNYYSLAILDTPTLGQEVEAGLVKRHTNCSTVVHPGSDSQIICSCCWHLSTQSPKSVVSVCVRTFTAKENISIGDIDSLAHDPLVVAAAQKARAHSFVTELPQKYDTILSKLFEQGRELSIGQWQRISLARLFMKNSPVLIFDEPTASLDVLTESGILGEIQLAAQSKICILISHRMSRAQTIDDIIVLEHGEIAERGTFAQLMSNNGKFTYLWQIYNSSK